MIVVVISSGYGWSVLDCSGNFDWLRVNALWTIMSIATGYGWTACGALCV